MHMIPDLSRAYQSDKFDNEEKIITDENIGKRWFIYLQAKTKNVYMHFS